MVVVAVAPPRPRRDIAHFDKLPVGHVSRLQAEIIADRRRHIETGAVVQVRLRPLALENVLEMIGAKRPAIFPLRVSGAVALANGNPAMLANGLARLAVSLFEPRESPAALPV